MSLPIMGCDNLSIKYSFYLFHYVNHPIPDKESLSPCSGRVQINHKKMLSLLQDMKQKRI